MSKDPERKWTPSVAPKPKSKPGPRAEAGGRPLEPDVRREMEAKLGEDFSGVRVHSGPEATESAHGLGARAYTIGEDVAFGAGELAPDTPRGTRLLEHELGHVVEQRHGAPLGVYRAPEGETELGREPRATPHLRLDPGLGGLSLGLATLDDFDLNQATLKPKHLTAIADVAGKLTMLLTKMPAGRITVSGHTDALGGEDVNLQVGRRRAEAVAASLEKEGIPPGAIRVVSEGKHEPVVKTKRAEPRNRRVEVRFEGQLVTPETGLGLRTPAATDQPTKVDLTFHPHFGTPTQLPPLFQPGPALKSPTQPTTAPDPAERDKPTRAGTAGDALKALAATEPVKSAIKRAQETGESEWKRLPTGEKAVVVSTGVSMAALAAVGISSDPAARKTALGALDGLEIPVPGVPGLKLKALTSGGAGIGGGIQIDVIKLVGGK
jgi:outer membrane protein OmpA-like peptidoglycan-associated protein